METDSDGTAITIFHQTDREIAECVVYDAASFYLTAIRGVPECFDIVDLERIDVLAAEIEAMKLHGVAGDRKSE